MPGRRVTFAKSFVKDEISHSLALSISWGFLLISVLAGLWTLMALAGTQAKKRTLTAESVYARNIRLPSVVQVVGFLLGMGFSIYVGIVVSAPGPATANCNGWQKSESLAQPR